MVLRPEVVKDRLAFLRQTVVRLQVVQARDPDVSSDWAIERGVQVAAQALFDVGNHVLAGGFGAHVGEYAAVPEQLAALGVISHDLAQRLRGLAGFRNLLVHDYVRVDPVRVRQLAASRVQDFLDFAEAMETWLAQ